MISWALTFLIIAIIAGVLGLNRIPGIATEIAYMVLPVAPVCSNQSPSASAH